MSRDEWNDLNIQRDSWNEPWANAGTPHDAEQFELRDHDHVLRAASARPPGIKNVYKDGSTIDWLREEAAERARKHHLRRQEGLRGLLLPILDSSRIWLIMITTGVGVGVAGAWLDVLVKWLSDLREGRCSYGFFYNQVACCSGLDPGDVCTEWLTWSQWFNIRSILAQSLLQASIYNVLAIAFSASAAILVLFYAPYAFHTGIPEIKAILGGYVFDAFLGPWTLLIKSLGLALAVASGLSLGKEGPLVHVACCMANLMTRLFKDFQHNEAQKRRILAAAAAAGISVAFGSPLGGVLFGLEELDTFANESEVIWRGFVTSVIAAVSLQYIDPFGTSKLVLFQVTAVSDTWRTFELVPWFALSVLGGILGSLLIRLNVAAAVYRKNGILNEHPILEVVGATALTGAISYLIVFLRVQASELVANLFQECDPARGDYHGLCNPNALAENVFLLVLTAAIKIGLTAWTFGMMVPAGIFLPTIAIGASLGRAVGLITFVYPILKHSQILMDIGTKHQGLHRAYPNAWVFSSCPPDVSVRCVSPGFYAVIGASAMLGGVTRMTISLVVILFELTGALSHVLPIMISVMVSKWVADAFGKEGIYSSWIAMRRYPWLPPVEYHDKGETGADIMVPFERLVTISADGVSVQEIMEMLETHKFHGFPVITYGKQLLGFVTREKLRAAIDPLLSDDLVATQTAICTFLTPSPDPAYTNLSDILEDAAIQLKKEVPQELVVNVFQKLNLRYILFSQTGQLTGLVTKSDIVSLINSQFPHTGALVDRQPENHRVLWDAGS